MFKSQNSAYNHLKQILLKPNKYYGIKGKSGVGKSYLLDHIEKFLENNNYKVINIEGDKIFSDRDYYPFKLGLTSRAEKFDEVQRQKENITEFTKKVPQVGEILNIIARNSINKSSNKQKSLNYFLSSEEELDLVFRLKYAINNSSTVIMCNNLQYFDKKSLDLLYLLIKNQSEYFPFLNKVIILVTITSDLEESNYSLIDKIISVGKFEIVTIEKIQFEEFDTCLEIFGLNTELDSKMKKIIYELSGGHLEVIKQLVYQLNQDDLSHELLTKSNNSLKKLIEQRLNHLESKGEQISILLEYASLIGTKFLNYELEFISDYKESKFWELMSESDTLKLLSHNKKYSNFTHDIIRFLFETKANSKILIYSERMGKCLKEIYPGDYQRRLMYLLKSNNHKESVIICSLLILKKMRMGNFNIPNELNEIIHGETVSDYLKLMKEAIFYFNNKKYKEVIRTLECIEEIYPVELLAEKDILLSTAKTKYLETDSREGAIESLAKYAKISDVNNEGEIYVRIKLSFISALTHFGKIGEAIDVEKEISQYLSERIKYDPNALTLLNVLRRKSNALHDCNIAKVFIGKSVEYFSPKSGNNIPLNPIQYFMSLNNYASILTECGEFSEALKNINLAIKLIEDNPLISFPREHIVVNNYLLLQYFHDGRNLNSVLKQYKQLINISQYADNIFIISNYCALLINIGKLNEAEAFLEEKLTFLKSINEHEKLYIQSVLYNLLIIAIINNEWGNSQKLLNELNETNKNLIDTSFYMKRNEVFQSIINSNSIIKSDKVDEILFKFQPKFQGTPWKYWGKTCNYTMLYYWSES